MITHRLALTAVLLAGVAALQAQVNQVQTVAPNIYFHEGDIQGKGHCNNGWIIFDDYVLVVDANFPSGAEEIIPKIKKQTDKPIRFAFDTHHHGDHAYGNAVWVREGAVPVAHTGVRDEMKKYEPGRWNDAAKGRKDVADSQLKEPTLLFPKELYFDDGKRRVELHHFGVAHTHGDGFAWLPSEKILFTGDACVNGAYNFVGDGNLGKWVETLEHAKKLNPKVVCPGHGPMGDASMLDDQQAFFRALLAEGKKLVDSKATKQEIKTKVDQIKAEFQKNQKIARYVGGSFPAQLEKAITEQGGPQFLTAKERDRERHKHEHAHGEAHDHDHSDQPATPKPAKKAAARQKTG